MCNRFRYRQSDRRRWSKSPLCLTLHRYVLHPVEDATTIRSDAHPRRGYRLLFPTGPDRTSRVHQIAPNDHLLPSPAPHRPDRHAIAYQPKSTGDNDAADGTTHFDMPSCGVFTLRGDGRTAFWLRLRRHGDASSSSEVLPHRARQQHQRRANGSALVGFLIGAIVSGGLSDRYGHSDHFSSPGSSP